MGQFIAAKYAWMIPTRGGRVVTDNPREPGTLPIYKVPIEEADEFIERFSNGDFAFVPLYSDIIRYHCPPVETRKKKSEGSK